MAVLTLIRHGQATPFEKITDRLSPLGELQARKLGEHWVSRGGAFDAVYCGSLVRQRRTAEIVGACYREAGLPWPEPQVDERLNEYDGAGVLKRLGPQLSGSDPAFRALVEAHRDNAGGADRNRHFQRMFEAVVAGWMSGELRSPDVEPWQAFRGRVKSAVDAITAGGGGRRIAVFTSGGPIGATVQQALQAPAEAGIALSWRIRNCSVTEILFSKGRMTLDCFNVITHLQDSALHSFR